MAAMSFEILLRCQLKTPSTRYRRFIFNPYLDLFK